MVYILLHQLVITAACSIRSGITFWVYGTFTADSGIVRKSSALKGLTLQNSMCVYEKPKTRNKSIVNDN